MAAFSLFQDFPAYPERMYAQETDFDRRECMSFPPLNIGEDSRAVYIRALAPGVEPDALHLRLEGRTLIIEGEIPPLPGRYFRQERFSGTFRRTVSLAVSVRRDELSARLRDGVLEIVLPKEGGGRLIPIDHRG